MTATIMTPEKLVREAKRRGINIESRVIELLTRDLGLDPKGEVITHLELATRYLREAHEMIEKGDATQASEKLYKVAEECIKAMAEALGLEEAQEARSKRRWTLGLLDKAAEKLAEKIDRRIQDDWSHAYFLHIEGFHESRLTIDRVKARAKYIEELLEITKKTIENIIHSKQQ